MVHPCCICDYPCLSAWWPWRGQATQVTRQVNHDSWKNHKTLPDNPWNLNGKFRDNLTWPSTNDSWKRDLQMIPNNPDKAWLGESLISGKKKVIFAIFSFSRFIMNVWGKHYLTGPWQTGHHMILKETLKSNPQRHILHVHNLWDYSLLKGLSVIALGLRKTFKTLQK